MLSIFNFFVSVMFVVVFYNESSLVHSGLITHLGQQCFSPLNLFLPAIPSHTICEHLRSVQELVPSKAAVWLSACRPRPRSHMKSIGWFASNDEYRSSALGSSLVSYLFQYLRSFCLRLDDLIGPQRIWRWTSWCAFISLQSFWIGKHVFDPVVSKFRLPSGISARSILLRFWVPEPIVWHFCFLCTQLHGLHSLASRLTSGLLVCRLYCSKQLALMVCWPQGRRMGNATWSRCRRKMHLLPLQQTRNHSLSLFLACSLFSPLMHYILLKIKVGTYGFHKELWTFEFSGLFDEEKVQKKSMFF